MGFFLVVGVYRQDSGVASWAGGGHGGGHGGHSCHAHRQAMCSCISTNFRMVPHSVSPCTRHMRCMTVCMLPAATRVPDMRTPEIILSLGGLGKSPGDRESHRAGKGNRHGPGTGCEGIFTSASQCIYHGRKLQGYTCQTCAHK